MKILLLPEKGHDNDVEIKLEANQEHNIFVLACSEGNAELDLKIKLASSGAKANIFGLFIGRGNSQQNLNLEVIHESSHCESYQIIRGVFFDKAKGSFRGKIIVPKNIKQTVAHQSARSLMLSPNAEVSTQPELEIDSDDIICSHGATVGQLDPNHLFYLISRGISEGGAKKILVKAFVQELLDKLDGKKSLDLIKKIESMLG